MPTHYARVFKWHLLFCIFYYQLRELLDSRSWDELAKLADPTDLALTLAFFLILFAFAAGAYFVLHRTQGRAWYVTALGLVISTTAGIALRYLIEEVIAPVTVGYRNYAEGTSLLAYFLDNLYFAILHGGIGAIVYLIEFAGYRERQRQELEIENQRTEMAYLRSQINPHFLFNTLNNVYSLFFQQSDKALKVIERLTAMLRYGLYEKAPLVPLQAEVDQLLNYLELEKLRLSFEPSLHLRLPPPDPSVRLPPLLLITFLENAFKHGDLAKPLHVELTTNNNRLTYRVTNHVKEKQKDKVGGIGMENLRKRLALLYPDRHILTAEPQGEIFVAELEIEL